MTSVGSQGHPVGTDIASFSIPFSGLKESNYLPKVTWLVARGSRPLLYAVLYLDSSNKSGKATLYQLRFDRREWVNGCNPQRVSKIMVACWTCNREKILSEYPLMVLSSQVFNLAEEEKNNLFLFVQLDIY